MYVLLCGYPPFYEDSNEKLFELIKAGKLEFPSPQWDSISDAAKDLIKNLLNINPKQRYAAQQIWKVSNNISLIAPLDSR
jgi:calcium/calmodulin-dependent protein kinase I